MSGILQVWPEVRDNDGKWHLIMRDEMGPCTVCHEGRSTIVEICQMCNGEFIAPKPFYSLRLDDNCIPALDWIMSEESYAEPEYSFPFASGSYCDRPDDLSDDTTELINYLEQSLPDYGDAEVCIAPMQSMLDYDWSGKHLLTFEVGWHFYREWANGEFTRFPQFDLIGRANKRYTVTAEEAMAAESYAEKNKNGERYDWCSVQVKDWEFCPSKWVPGITEALRLMSSVAPPERTRAVMFYCNG